MKKKAMENLNYDGSATLEKIPCPLCGGNDFRPMVVEHTLSVGRCRQCDLGFANPRPNREGLQRFYDNYFPPESETIWQRDMANIFLREGLQRIQEFQKQGAVKFNSPPELLDIGCGMGFFLDLMRKEGWVTQGIEPAPEAAKHARDKLKLNVFEGTIEDVDIQQQFDVVTLWYVLEHVPNPHEIIQRAAELLRSGGLLIIRVPNQNIPVDVWLSRLGLGKFFLMNPPRHLFDYSPKTISGFLEKYGFDVLKIRNGIPRATGTWLELIRRHLWYNTFEALYHLTGGKLIRGSSMTVYGRKK